MYPNLMKKPEKIQLVTGWTWEHYDICWLCSKNFPDTNLHPQLPCNRGERRWRAEVIPVAKPVNHPKLA